MPRATMTRQGIPLRLTDKQLNAIRTEIQRVDPDGIVYLFGSRADDNRRGGDIDLFVEASFDIPYKTRLLLEARLASACDTDVDLVIRTPGHEENILHGIAKNGIRL